MYNVDDDNKTNDCNNDKNLTKLVIISDMYDDDDNDDIFIHVFIFAT